VTQGEYQKLEVERDQLAAQTKELNGQVTALEAERDRLGRQLAAAKGQATKVDAERMKAKIAKAYEELKLTPGQKINATLVTDAGNITCELWPDIAPKTVSNFVGLSEGTREWTDPNTNEKTMRPLYNGTIFHRLIPNFMIQGGDPLGSGRGGPGYRFEDEVRKDVRFDQPGLLAMANSGPATNGSQFFITDSKPSHLNMKHTIFGKCGDMDVVKKIITAPTTDRRSNRPVDPVSIQRIDVKRL